MKTENTPFHTVLTSLASISSTLDLLTIIFQVLIPLSNKMNTTQKEPSIRSKNYNQCVTKAIVYTPHKKTTIDTKQKQQPIQHKNNMEQNERSVRHKNSNGYATKTTINTANNNSRYAQNQLIPHKDNHQQSKSNNRYGTKTTTRHKNNTAQKQYSIQNKRNNQHKTTKATSNTEQLLCVELI